MHNMAFTFELLILSLWSLLSFSNTIEAGEHEYELLCRKGGNTQNTSRNGIFQTERTLTVQFFPFPLSVFSVLFLN